MIKYLPLLFLAAHCFAQTGNGCSTNTAAATGSIQSYGLCQPQIIDGRNRGGWIALNRVGDQSNSEKQCYSPINASINGGLLTLQARALTKTCHYWPAQTGTGSLAQTIDSAFVQWNTFSFTGGDVLVRAKGPGGAAGGGGAWPAIWLLGANCEQSSKVTADNGTFGGGTCNWSSAGSEEIDIFEQTGTGGFGTTKSTCACFMGVNQCANPTYSFTDSSTNWHVYEVRWVSGTSIQWWVDGVHQTSCDYTGAGIPTTPMFLQLDLAMNSTATTAGLGTTLQVDWVKVCSTTCANSGSNIVFFDDFVVTPTQTLIKPLPRMARIATAGTPPPTNPVFTMGVAKNEVPKLK